MEIADKVTGLIQRYTKFDQWEDRYKELIRSGKTLDPMDEEEKEEKFRVKGCQSQVWLKPVFKEGLVYFKADSDAILVKGIISLLLEVYSGEAPESILNNSPDFLKEIGITEHLTMNRTNGLASMVKQVQVYATAFSALKNKGVLNADL